MPSAAEISALAGDIERSHQVFLGESSYFSSADQIDKALLSALYFARAAAALSDAGGRIATVRNRLGSAEQKLRQAEGLMASSATAPVMAGALSSTAAPVIGPADARSSASEAQTLARFGLATVRGDAAQSPLSLGEEFARPSPAGGLPYELGGASVSVAGRAAQMLYASAARIEFVVPAELPAGEHELIVTSNDGFVSRGVVAVADVLPGLFAAAGTGEAVAMNAVTFQRGGFDITTPEALGADKRTRVALFATGIFNLWNSDASNDLREGDRTHANVAESVALAARTSDGRAFWLPVEFAGGSRALPGLDQLIFRLIPELRGAGVVQLTLWANARESNTVTINVR